MDTFTFTHFEFDACNMFQNVRTVGQLDCRATEVIHQAGMGRKVEKSEEWRTNMPISSFVECGAGIKFRISDLYKN